MVAIAIVRLSGYELHREWAQLRYCGQTLRAGAA